MSGKSIWPALPGACFVGFIGAIVGAVAVDRGAGAVLSTGEQLTEGIFLAAASIGFTVSAVVMLLVYVQYGSMIVSVRQAAKNLWEAFGTI